MVRRPATSPGSVLGGDEVAVTPAAGGRRRPRRDGEDPMAICSILDHSIGSGGRLDGTRWAAVQVFDWKPRSRL